SPTSSPRRLPCTRCCTASCPPPGRTGRFRVSNPCPPPVCPSSTSAAPELRPRRPSGRRRPTRGGGPAPTPRNLTMVAFLRLALRRVAMMPVMVLGIALLVFVVLQFSPVDPAYNALGDSASPEARAAFAEAQGLNDPLPVRYVAFL